MRVFKSLEEYYLFLNYLNLLLIDILLEKNIKCWMALHTLAATWGGEAQNAIAEDI